MEQLRWRFDSNKPLRLPSRRHPRAHSLLLALSGEGTVLLGFSLPLLLVLLACVGTRNTRPLGSARVAQASPRLRRLLAEPCGFSPGFAFSLRAGPAP